MPSLDELRCQIIEIEEEINLLENTAEDGNEAEITDLMVLRCDLLDAINETAFESQS